MNDQLTDHFLTILNKLLCAFRKKYSCQSLLIKIVDESKTAINNKYSTGSVFMDLSKAFDCLPHGLMIAKYHAYGFILSTCQDWRVQGAYRLQSCQWFKGMKANPDNIPFKILSPSPLYPVELALDATTTITSQNCVKMLVVTIENHLTFNDHSRSSCSKAARQLNVFARISKYLSFDLRRVMHQSFILCS